jgi:hypothetical protein
LGGSLGVVLDEQNGCGNESSKPAPKASGLIAALIPTSFDREVPTPCED